VQFPRYTSETTEAAGGGRRWLEGAGGGSAASEVVGEPRVDWQNARVDSLAITVVGHDRPGIIARTAEVLSAYRMNLEDSSMTLLRGHFAMTLICAGEAAPGEVEQALVAAVDPSLSVTVRAVPEEDEPIPVGSTHLVTVHGADRLGIVARLAGTIAAAGGNITDLTTRLTGSLYVLVAEVDLPPAADAAALQAELTRAGRDLGVDVTVRRVENDEL
jgi:glycine cleavage system transcriptional repressor